MGWIVSVALSVGLLGWLIAAADCGPAAGLRRIFRRWWFPLTLVPTALLAFAVRERVGVYGVTADRYALGVAAAVSIGFLALWFARLRPPTIRSVLVVGALVSLAAAVGPVNMPATVAGSQIARLKAILSGAGLLTDGRVTQPVSTERWTNERASEIATIINALNDVSAQNRLAEVMPLEQARERRLAQTFLGAQYRAFAPAGATSAYFAREGGVVPVNGGELIGPFQLARSGRPGDADSVTTTVDGADMTFGPKTLTVRRAGVETAFDLSPLRDVPTGQDRRPVSLPSVDGRSTLLLLNGTIYKRASGVEAVSLGGTVFIARP